MTTLFVNSTIRMKADAAQVWDALTNPEQTKKYMFGCETISDWKVGSSLLWQMVYEGKDFVAVKGYITHIELNKKLSYTVFDPNSSIPDIPENYLTVTYELNAENGFTELLVTQADYATVAEGERRYQEAWNNGEGWNPILIQIKKLVETTKEAS